MNKLFTILSLSLIVAPIRAACPPFQTANLDLEQHMGTWQIHGMLRTSSPISNLQCLYKELSGKDFENEPVNIEAMIMGIYADTGEMLHATAEVQINDLIVPGRWSVNFNGTTSKGFALYSDYVDYSLFALCHNDGEMYEALFMSRYHDPISETIVSNFKELLKDTYDIPTDNYVSIFHDHTLCGHHH